MHPLGAAVATALVAGALGTLLLPASPAWPWWCVVAVAGLYGCWRGGAWRVGGAFACGASLAGLHAVFALALQLPAELERADLPLSGRVVGLPEHDVDRTRFLFRVDRGDAMSDALQGRLLRLAWYDDRDGASTGRHALEAGSRWAFTARVRAPRGLRNPGWYDSEKHAFARRIAAVGYVRDREPPVPLRAGQGIDRWREQVAQRIGAAVPSASSRYVRALALGDTRGLDEIDWETLRATGLTHLIAISGFHVGLVAGFFALLAGGLWKLWPPLGRLLPRPHAAVLATFSAALFYAAVAGWALPTVRTVLMIGVAMAARLWRRPLGVADALALAGIAVVAVDPLSLLTAGFWLSFAGVAWLVWCLPDAQGKPVLASFLRAQWVATLGLLPLTVILFGQASLAGPVANLVAIPWWSLVVVPLSLLGTALDAVHAGWGAGTWRLAAWCFDLGWPLFERLAASGASLWWLPEARWFALPLAVLAAFWLLLPRGVPGKPLAALLWLPLLWPDRQLPGHGAADITVLDVGQGLSVLVRTRHHALLYDMGPAVPDGYDAGERVVLPALHALGVRRVHALVASHADLDHAGGLAAVRRRFPAAPLFAPEHAGLGVRRRASQEAAGRWMAWASASCIRRCTFPISATRPAACCGSTPRTVRCCWPAISVRSSNASWRARIRPGCVQRWCWPRTMAAGNRPIRCSLPPPAPGMRWCRPATATASGIRRPTRSGAGKLPVRASTTPRWPGRCGSGWMRGASRSRNAAPAIHGCGMPPGASRGSPIAGSASRHVDGCRRLPPLRPTVATLS